MNNSSGHLSEDAIDNLLAGAATASDDAHLDACETCKSRVASFRSSITSFKVASAAWAQARSNTISRDLAPSTSTSGQSTAASWSLAAALLLSVGAAVKPALVGRNAIPESLVDDSRSTARAEQISGDNALLQSIDFELSEPVASPLEIYAMQEPASAGHLKMSRVRD